MRLSIVGRTSVGTLSSQDLVAFLRRQRASPSLVEAFEVQRVTGAALEQRDALLVGYLGGDVKTATDLDIPDDVLIDALLRTEGWSVKHN